MNNFKCFLLSITYLLLFVNEVNAQHKNKDGWIVYERGFEFKKGIYRSFSEFKNNSPAFPGQVENKNGLLYLENDSLKKMVPFRSSHWGYSNGKNIYLKTYDSYARIGIIGELSYFGIVSSPSAGSAIGMSSAGGVGIGIGVGGGNSVSEYLLDFNTGGFIPFNRKNFEIILHERDPLLFEQYKSKKGKKKEKMHIYLSAYNDKHPIYFPE